MRILILTDEAWDDKTNPNNVLTNWFQGINAELAQIYCSCGRPHNDCCSMYFQITDKMMLNSIIRKKRAGVSVKAFEQDNSKIEKEDVRLYSRLKKVSLSFGNIMRFCRECLWTLGKYDITALRDFIGEFNPDVIFSIRMASVKQLRLEKIVHELTLKPIFAFTGDDEYTLKQISFSPLFWIRRFWIRSKLRQMSKIYNIYYTNSEVQRDYYKRIFNCDVKLLTKCGDFDDVVITKEVHSPIRFVYAGKLYCNRWKTLRLLANEMAHICLPAVPFELNIYTRDKITSRQKKSLFSLPCVFFRGSVSGDQLKDIYRDSDVALHIESFDMINREKVKFSFSTKIIDCMQSGCAVMAICDKNQGGLLWLKKNDAAFTASNKAEIMSILMEINERHSKVYEYKKKAVNVGKSHHNRDRIQNMLLADFQNADGGTI